MTRYTVRVLASAALLLGLTAPISAQQAAAGHQPAEVAAVLEVMDELMRVISRNDLRAMEEMQTPDGMTYRARRDTTGAWLVQSRSNLAWVAPSQETTHTYLERYWDPTVLVRGAIAMVWAPYEFLVDGRTSHCGVDLFTFVKIDGRWRLANSSWTVEPDACAELRPANAGPIRPAN